MKLEIELHRTVGHHQNIIKFFGDGEDVEWKWIAMELAEGGDLFDKIESDVGVGEDIAHFYFTQLINAVEYMHSKGVGHRDLKPENILLSADGNLKIADFGLATLFEYQGKRKLCLARCGSPPYSAPEVLAGECRTMGKLEKGYQADLVDIWSCGVILFVLLVGNTPWDEPVDRSYEFHEYVKTGGNPNDELWHNLPTETLPLLKGIMRVEADRRFSIRDIRNHSWMKRKNQYIDEHGGLQNAVGLATEMFESMKVDFSQNPFASQQSQRSLDAMDIDSQPQSNVSAVEAMTPTQEISFDWERPSQQMVTTDCGDIDERMAEDPSFSQFSVTPQVPLTKTQIARQFNEILPSQSLTRFYSMWQLDKLQEIISDALQKLDLWDKASSLQSQSRALELGSAFGVLKIRGKDTRNCKIVGEIMAEVVPGTEEQLAAVSFIREQGDPVEWRRLFKKVVLLCKDAVFRPDEHLSLLSQQP